MWLVYALLSALFAALTSLLAKIGISEVNSNLATAIRTTVVLVMAWGIVLLTGKQHGIEDITRRSWTFLILSGLSTGASWLCYFRALQIGDVDKVVSVDKSSAILSILLAFLFLHESISPLKLLCVVLIGAGTYLMITKKETSSENSGKKGWSWFFYALGSAVFASLTSILGNVGIENIDSNLGTAIRTIVVLIMAWIVVFVTKKQDSVRTIDHRELGFICLSGLATGASWLCYYRALQDGLASVVVPIDKLSILVTILFSYLVFHEKLGKKEAGGLVLIVAGTLGMLV